MESVDNKLVADLDNLLLLAVSIDPPPFFKGGNYNYASQNYTISVYFLLVTKNTCNSNSSYELVGNCPVGNRAYF